MPQATQKFRDNNQNAIPKTSTDTAGEVRKISHDKLTPMPEKFAFTFHHNFYPKLKVYL